MSVYTVSRHRQIIGPSQRGNVAAPALQSANELISMRFISVLKHKDKVFSLIHITLPLHKTVSVQYSLLKFKEMKTIFLRSHLYLLRCTSFTNSSSHPRFLIPIKTTSYPKISAKSHNIDKPLSLEIVPRCQNTLKWEEDSLQLQVSPHGNSRVVILGAVSLGLVLFLIGMDDQKALALGPEGPLMEEFWENVRRYGLYALTVSTGALYTIFQPIFELLKNPISAVLVLTILGGGIFIVSQVVSAMVGVTDFTYDYGY